MTSASKSTASPTSSTTTPDTSGSTEASDYPPYRIAINHQENVPPKWHHKDGWPRKVIRSRITSESLIHYIIAIRDMNTEERTKAFNSLAECAPNLTVQTVMAVLEERYLYVSGWGP
jgi:hypothetical protein